MNKIKIGINGFGRIGRALTRINLINNIYDIVVINEIDPDINNLAYLLKYDTTYGKLKNDKVDVEKNHLLVNGSNINVFHESNTDEVPWADFEVDVIIDCSGINQNVINSRLLLERGIKKVIISHSPEKGIDFTFMNGVNEKLYDKKKHKIISSSICDANALGPFYKLIDDCFGIEISEVTTLHPWLSYQNLLDGNLKSISSPGHFWNDYALGRSSIGSMIPKNTTLVNALKAVIPDVDLTMHASSFRTPTSIVSAADGVFYLKQNVTIDQVKNALNKYCTKYPDVLFPDNRSLVSIDYLGNEYAAVVDTRWLHVNKGKLLKFVLWYDNEWGYSSRIYKIIKDIL